MSMKIVIALLMTIVIFGCSNPIIDASSDEAMKSSIEKVRQSLPKDKRAKFDEALQILAFSQFDLKSLFTEGAAGIGDTKAKMKATLNGKTGDEVIAEAEKVKEERKEREKAQALAEIKEIEEKKAKSEKAREELKKFEVIRSRFYKKKREFFGTEPIIELIVHNGTKHAVSRAYFRGTLASPNRSVPWLREDFNYQISGGLEPGEKATWKLTLNMFSKWGSVDAPLDAILTVEVVQIDGPNGRPLFEYTYIPISPKELMEMMKQNSELIIVDTRIKEHFKEGHIKGAVNLSYTSIKSMNKVLEKEKSKDIVVYSEDGERSRKICEVLVSLGYSKISNLDNGIKGWTEAGGKIEK